jgi:hypothetical protein
LHGELCLLHCFYAATVCQVPSAPQPLCSPPRGPPSPRYFTQPVTFHLFFPRHPGHHSPLVPALLAPPNLRAATSHLAGPWRQPPASLPRASSVAFAPRGRRRARRWPHGPRGGPPLPTRRSPPATRSLLQSTGAHGSWSCFAPSRPRAGSGSGSGPAKPHRMCVFWAQRVEGCEPCWFPEHPSKRCTKAVALLGTSLCRFMLGYPMGFHGTFHKAGTSRKTSQVLPAVAPCTLADCKEHSLPLGFYLHS